MAAVVSPDDLPLLAPRRRLSGKRLPDQKQTMSLVGHSIFWGGVARIDVLQVRLAGENLLLRKVCIFHFVENDLRLLRCLCTLSPEWVTLLSLCESRPQQILRLPSMDQVQYLLLHCIHHRLTHIIRYCLKMWFILLDVICIWN